MGRPFSSVTPKQAKLLTMVEGMLSCFFQPSAAVGAIGQVCQTHSESPVGERQHIPVNQPGEQEIRVVQEAQT